MCSSPALGRGTCQERLTASHEKVEVFYMTSSIARWKSVLHDESDCTRIDGVAVVNVHTPYTKDDARS